MTEIKLDDWIHSLDFLVFVFPASTVEIDRFHAPFAGRFWSATEVAIQIREALS